LTIAVAWSGVNVQFSGGGISLITVSVLDWWTPTTPNGISHPPLSTLSRGVVGEYCDSPLINISDDPTAAPILVQGGGGVGAHGGGVGSHGGGVGSHGGFLTAQGGFFGHGMHPYPGLPHCSHFLILPLGVTHAG